jgi:hypothetical protein
MREARPGTCARKDRAVTRNKPAQKREARPGRCARKGRADARGKSVIRARQSRSNARVIGRSAKHCRADARGKAGYLRDAMPGIWRCKAGQIRDARQGTYAMQGGTKAQGKAWHMREALQLREVRQGRCARQ